MIMTAIAGVTDRLRTDRVRELISGSGLPAAYIVLVLFLIVADPRFFRVQNLESMVVQNTGLALVAIGMTYAIIGGSWDLSVGAVAGLSGVLFAKLTLEHSIVLAAIVAVAGGVCFGALNGFIVARLRVNSFMATFATGLAISGIALAIQGPAQITVLTKSFALLGGAHWGPIPEPLVLSVFAFVLGGIILQRTSVGQNIYAVGSNREAARLIGLPVNRAIGGTFVVSGFLAAVAGLVMASQLGLGAYDSGQSLPIEAIAAVVIGGISVYGGEGRMWRAALGTLILATLNNAFVGLGWPVEIQAIAEGIVIVFALAANRLTFKSVGQRARSVPLSATAVPRPAGGSPS